MNQNQFYNQTHFDSTVSSTEGLVTQAANCLNGQAETVATGGVHGTGDVPEPYDQSFGQHNENSHYIFGKFSGVCHRYNHLRGLYATGTKVVPQMIHILLFRTKEYRPIPLDPAILVCTPSKVDKELRR